MVASGTPGQEKGPEEQEWHSTGAKEVNAGFLLFPITAFGFIPKEWYSIKGRTFGARKI